MTNNAKIIQALEQALALLREGMVEVPDPTNVPAPSPLPAGSLVRDSEGDIWESDGTWWVCQDECNIVADDEMIEEAYGPIEVIRVGHGTVFSPMESPTKVYRRGWPEAK